MTTSVDGLLSERSDLAELRRAKGITLENIRSSTLIDVHFLEAIETDDFAELPGGVYNTSYIRQYAREIGYDEAALLSRYYRQIHPEPAPACSSFKSRLGRWFRDQQIWHLLQSLAERRKNHQTA